MDVLHTHCAGLDIHKDTVVACSRRVTAGKVIREVRTFKTTTSELLALSDWLGSLGATHIAMEATGVYWKPVWNILSDGDFELILANAAHVKNVPGRKTDVNDATWLADLLAHGLIRASFVPDTQTQEQRGLLRTRKQLTRERTSHIQRLQKTLEEANIKLELGDFRPHRRERTGHDRGLDRGRERSAAAGKPCKQPDQSLARHAWRGFVTRHHRFLLRLHLQQIDALDRAIAEIDKEVEANLAPFRELIPVLTSIPGIGELAARVLLAEIGTDMSRFPTSGHLISWAGLCPRNDQSAGKRRSTRMRKGAPWLKTVLIQCAWAGARKKGSYLEAQFHRLRARRGAKKAVGAVAASILTAAYHMIAEGTFYQDLGADHFQRRAKPSQIKRLVAKIQSLGYNVEIKPLAA